MDNLKLGFLLDLHKIYNWQEKLICHLIEVFETHISDIFFILNEIDQIQLTNNENKELTQLEKIKSRFGGINFNIVNRNTEINEDALVVDLGSCINILEYNQLVLSFLNSTITDPVKTIEQAILKEDEKIDFNLSFVAKSNTTTNKLLRIGSLPLINYSFSKALNSLLSEIIELYILGIQEVYTQKLTCKNNSVIFSANKIDFYLPIKLKLKLLKNTLTKIKESFSHHDNWNIGILKLPKSAVVNSPKTLPIKWFLPEDPMNFRADPFGIKSYNEINIVYENFDFTKIKGHINAVSYNLSNNSFTNEITVLNDRTHLSYPFLLKYKNETYCIPESNKDRCIKLYKVSQDFSKFTFIKKLVNDFEAVDSTLVYYNNFWWIFCTDRKTGDRHKLHIFYSDDLMGNWQPHVKNPVKIDVSNSRPAGNIFELNNELYRPAQDGAGTYGRQLVINKITELTKSNFTEEPVSFLQPTDKKYSKGIHTLTYIEDDLWLVDGKNYKFNKYELLKRIKRLGKRIIK